MTFHKDLAKRLKNKSLVVGGTRFFLRGEGTQHKTYLDVYRECFYMNFQHTYAMRDRLTTTLAKSSNEDRVHLTLNWVSRTDDFFEVEDDTGELSARGLDEDAAVLLKIIDCEGPPPKDSKWLREESGLAPTPKFLPPASLSDASEARSKASPAAPKSPPFLTLLLALRLSCWSRTEEGAGENCGGGRGGRLSWCCWC